MQAVGIKDEDLIVCFNRSVEKEKIVHNLLSLAVMHNKLEVVKLLIQEGMNPNPSENGSVGSQWVAAYYNRLEMLKYLADSGADLNFTFDAKSHVYPTILHTAAYCNHYDIVFFLLLNSTNLEITNSEGKKASELSTDEFTINLFKSASFLDTAIKNLKSDKENIFSINAEILSALRMDADFIIAYLTKVAYAAVLRGQGLKHDETFYTAELITILRLVVKELKTLTKIFPELLTQELNQKYLTDLVVELNAYDPTSTHFDESEKIFKSFEEKAKTLKSLETHLSFASTKAKMKEGNSTPATLIASSSGSPVFDSNNNNNSSNDSLNLNNVQVATKTEETIKMNSPKH